MLGQPKRLKSLLSFNHKGYLKDIGWFKAFDTRSPVDQFGDPIPWVTYSFIDFISGRLNKQHAIFEFGSGNSTFFYAKYAGLVTPENWAKFLESPLPPKYADNYAGLVG